MKTIIKAITVTAALFTLAGCATVQVPKDAAAREHFFLKEDHGIEARCGWLGVIDAYTGESPVVQVAGEYQPATNPRMVDGMYMADFNGGSLTFVYKPGDTEANGRAGIQSKSGFVPCSWSFFLK